MAGYTILFDQDYIDACKLKLPPTLLNQFICAFIARARNLADTDEIEPVIGVILAKVAVDSDLIQQAGTFILEVCARELGEI